MAAESIADELSSISIASIFRRWSVNISATPREAARRVRCRGGRGAILLFDEADALFGKRSEVKDSHDRFANIEIDYLLQRMEAFSGLAILATNVRNGIDPAFLRRLNFIVNFPYPAVAERRRIWESVFPAETPRATLDFGQLARLNLTGGNIHSVAINAAFMAAATVEKKVTMPLLLEAGRMELRKVDRPINEADFRRIQAVSNGEERR